MRRVLGALGIALAIGGAAALTPIFAALGAGFGLTGLAVGVSAWRRIRRGRSASGGQPVAAEVHS